jgi:hypothetical protein
MGHSESKLKCLYLPAQSGKTRKMENEIKYYKTLHECYGEDESGGYINVIISANNKVLVSQTETRMKNDLTVESEEGADDAVIKGGIFSWMSGEKECNISPDALAFRMLDEVEMVVLCAHPRRLKYLDEMLKRISSSKFFNKKINIWIDEADKSINLWSKYTAILLLPSINQVTLISATFDSVIAKYGSLNILPFEKTHPESYRRLKHAIKIEENLVADSAAKFVKHVVLKNRDKLIRPGLRAFIPGAVQKASHDEIADFLYRQGFIVIIINGERKEILIPGEDKINLRHYFSVSKDKIPEEFNAELAKLYTANNWSRFPLAITGCMCVERGVTFQCGPEEGVHDGFLFDYGVLPPIACKAEAYQTMARLFGNVGDFPNYKSVEIYTGSAMFKKVEKQEEIAVNLARMVYEKGEEKVTKKEFKDAETDSDWDFASGEFSTLEEANEFMRDHASMGKNEKSLEKEGDFFKSSTTGALAVLDYVAVKNEMSRWSKLSNLNPKAEKRTARMYVCYKDREDPKSAVYICRVAWRK